MNPALIGALGSIAGGFLGGQQEAELPPEMQRIYQFLMRMAREKRQYSRGIPGSDPGEQAALAQAKALAGQGQSQQYEGLLASLGTDNPNAADALQSFRSQAAGQNAGIDTSMLLQFLQNRRNAGMEAANIAQGAVGPGSAYRQPPAGMGADLGNIFGQWAQLQAFRQGSSQKPATPTVSAPIKGVQQQAPLSGPLPNYAPDRYRQPTYGDPASYWSL